MTLRQIIDLKNDFEQRLGNYRGIPSDEESVDQLNHALKIFGTKLAMFEPSVAVTLASGVSVYDLQDTTVFSRRILIPRSLIVNGRPLASSSATQSNLWSLQELEAQHPYWRNSGTGSPILGCWPGNRQLICWPAPTPAVVSGGSTWLSGTYIPGAIKADGTYLPGGFDVNYLDSTPDLDDTLHEALAFLAAVLAGTPIASDQVAWRRMADYNILWTDTVEEIRRSNRNALSPFGTTRGGYWRQGYRGR
ncbi:MAG: hypothetical protein JSS66_00170 [Armatimonadetes bacterium]|nr:hypothetical protein [Armatimonadota bacterium]